MPKKSESIKRVYDLPRGKFVRLRFDDLIRILALVEHHGQSKKLISESKAIETAVRIPSEAVKVVKELVAGHHEMSRSSLGKRILFRKKKSVIASRALPSGIGEMIAGGGVATGDNDCCDFPHGR